MRIYVRDNFEDRRLILRPAWNGPDERRRRRAVDIDLSETIASLKWKIRDEFGFTDDEMERRLLVPDGRDWRYPDPSLSFYGEDIDLIDDLHGSITLVDGRDLFDLNADTLVCGINDGATLVLGLNEPFKMHVEQSFSRVNRIVVSCYDKIRDLKDKIELTTGITIGEGNFPNFLLSSDADERTLLYFGFYNRVHRHRLFLNPDNTPFLDPFWHPFVDDDNYSTEDDILW